MALQNKRFIGYAQLWFIIFDFLKLAFVCFTPNLWCVYIRVSVTPEKKVRGGPARHMDNEMALESRH